MGGRNDKVEVIHSSHIRDFSWFVLINQCMWVREEGYAQSTLWCAVNESFLTWLHREEAGSWRDMASKSTS